MKRIGPVALVDRRHSWVGLLAIWIAGIVLALATLTLVLLLARIPLGESYRTMSSATFGSFGGLAQTLSTSTPLILTGLSVAVARRMGLWNLGGEGQLYVGALFATAVALWYPNSPRPVLLLAMLAAGAAGGAGWALGPALVKARFGVHEGATTLMLNIAALLLVATLAQGRWRDPLALGYPLTDQLSPNAAMPPIPRTSIHGGFLIAVGAALVLWFVLTRTPWGRKTREVSDDLGAGKAERRTGYLLLAMLVAGALAGVAGMGEVAGVAHRLHLDLSPGYGYIAILLAALARFSPLGVVVAAAPFGALLVIGYALNGLGLAPLAIRTAQGVIVLIGVATVVFARFKVRWLPSGRGAGSPA